MLTRLASEPESLAMVASKALEIMHFQKPEGEWNVSQLASLEKKDDLNNALCEAGCYQCLLSYYNQPDHENINRRNADALELLVALANANVKPVALSEVSIPAAAGDSLGQELLNVISQRGLNQPDATFVTVSGGAATAVAQYKGARALVFIQSPVEEIIRQLADKGWDCIDASDRSSWETLFSRYANVFGVSEEQAK